ncbi:hypothetical protein Trco_005602 [Trichoderma cornu-damae]|uniref:Uncharacterized protein n=1 Tax=Trichoderma cornu-damae TaxID=654480 RepID=A0A9P8QJR3_9HYPO|nr:hypothetical protein Trco_005602 [Trichoderma cornu-damae]
MVRLQEDMYRKGISKSMQRLPKDMSNLRRQEPGANTNEHAKQESGQLREMRYHVQHLEDMVRTLREDLDGAHRQVAALMKTVAENEAIITRAHSTAVSTLAGNVSRSITDDLIREELKKFFQNDFFSWCAELSAESVVDGNAALRKLREAGVINNSDRYWDGPEYLRFSIDSPDGSSPFVLLQAALAKRLCFLFLNDAYFLAGESNDRRRLRKFEQHFSQECLENSVPITEQYIQREVQAFVEEYEFLLRTDSYDEEANRDLAQIFADFAILSLKLWKTRVNIEWCDSTGFGNSIFDYGSPWMEVDQTLVSTKGGSRLSGRPVGLIIRPLIVAKPPTKEDRAEEVVWLKALAWVSSEEEPSLDSTRKS